MLTDHQPRAVCRVAVHLLFNASAIKLIPLRGPPLKQVPTSGLDPCIRTKNSSCPLTIDCRGRSSDASALSGWPLRTMRFACCAVGFVTTQSPNSAATHHISEMGTAVGG